MAGHPHPTQRLHQIGLHEFVASGVPIAMFDGCPSLHQAHGRRAHRHMATSPPFSVQYENPKQPVFPLTTGNQDSQTTSISPIPSIPYTPNRRGMAVQGG